MTTHGQQEDLKPCPFCGSRAEIEYDSDHHGEWFNLGCSKHWSAVTPVENACIGGRLFYTEPLEEEAKAVERWNRRALAPQSMNSEALAAHIAELQQILREKQEVQSW